MTTVVLVRHGETQWNYERRVQGWAPVPLNDSGREQARTAGDFLADEYDFDRVVASDLRRCKETTQQISEAGGFPDPEFVTGWRERHFGVYQGLLYEDVFDEHPELDLRQTGLVAMEVTPEAGESMLDTWNRVNGAWTGLLDGADDDEEILVVTHGGPIYVVLGEVKGMDAVTAIAEHSQRNCAVNEFSHVRDTGETEIVRENFVGYR